MDFPEEKSFTETEKFKKSWLPRLSRRIQWFLTLTSLAFYFGYIGLLAVWWLLGAIINPNAFLPFASAALTFITFVRHKYTQFTTLARDGRKAILSYLNKILGDIMSKMMKKLSESVEGASQYVLNQSKALLESEKFNNVAGTLASAGVIDQDTLEKMKKSIESINPQDVANTALTAANNPQAILMNVGKITENLVRNRNLINN